MPNVEQAQLEHDAEAVKRLAREMKETAAKLGERSLVAPTIDATATDWLDWVKRQLPKVQAVCGLPVVGLVLPPL